MKNRIVKLISYHVIQFSVAVVLAMGLLTGYHCFTQFDTMSIWQALLGMIIGWLCLNFTMKAIMKDLEPLIQPIIDYYLQKLKEKREKKDENTGN